ncbi:UDP-N-acetylglucosamine acyltransferase [Blastococcus litoris]|uniref:UDP-N-acetylglucosamine acyltransferase n=1 Tax=Blastococcus litoris TaxID=2171622 RepID=UPI000E30433B|nr:UDP-N-acetylglucosamine acyltransferase [Blastococcus litoris]
MPNRIHPTAVVSPGVELGDDNVIGPYAVVLGPSRIGDRNWIAPHVCIGMPPEHKAYGSPVAWDGEVEGVGVEIGSGVVLREFVTVHQGTERRTTISDGCYLMSRAHVGHDNLLLPGVTMAPGTAVAGHSVIWDGATLGMGAMIHQRAVVGPGAMVGMGSAIKRDVGPFTTTLGNPARVAGTNEVGLRRFDADEALVAAWPDVLAGRVPLTDDAPAALLDLMRRWYAAVDARGS